MVVAEVGLAGSRGDDQGVVRRAVGVAQQQRIDGSVGQIDVGDLSEKHLAVLLVTQNHSRRRRYLALGDDSGGHLIEQGLEEVVGGLGDQLDVDVGPLEFLGGVQATETRADDHDPVLIRQCGAGMTHYCSLDDCTGRECSEHLLR